MNLADGPKRGLKHTATAISRGLTTALAVYNPLALCWLLSVLTVVALSCVGVVLWGSDVQNERLLMLVAVLLGRASLPTRPPRSPRRSR
jgi:hypothetical protein